MARVIEQVEMRMEWADILRRVHHPFPTSHTRAPGVHLSGVLRYVAQEAGILAKPGVDSTRTTGLQQDIDEEEMPLRMMLGMFFEEGAAGLYPDMHWQPGELQKDQVFGNPDGISLIGNRLVVDEFKLTWKSEWNYGKDRFLSANWLWLGQGKGYLAMAREAGLDVLHVRFHICWVNGDYRPPSPKLVRYLVEFSQSEIDHFWRNIILKNRDNPGVKREL